MTGWRSNWREERRTPAWVQRGEQLLEQLRGRLVGLSPEKRDDLSEVHAAHQRCWAALSDLLDALDQPTTPGRLADAIASAKDVRDRNLPW